MQQVQAAFERLALPVLAAMVRSVEGAEGRRLTIELERQVWPRLGNVARASVP